VAAGPPQRDMNSVESPRHSDGGYQGSVPQRTSFCQLLQGHTACGPRVASVAGSRDG